MSGKKGSVIPVSGDDLATALKALKEDCGVEGRLTITLATGSTSDLRIVAEAFTDYGAKVGVSRVIEFYRPGDARPFMTRCMMALHKAYHAASELAHTPYAEAAREKKKR